MKKKSTTSARRQRRANARAAAIAVTVVALAITAGVGLAQIQPTGKSIDGVIQFDAVSELNLDEGSINWSLFARYWVCEDFYAVAVVWSEPHGRGRQVLPTLVVLSDHAGFRMGDEQFANVLEVNTSYLRPLGDRGPFRHGAGMYDVSEMRFAEGEALARRVYVSDIEGRRRSGQDVEGTYDLETTEDAATTDRDLTQLRIDANGDRIESMELLDKRQQLLGRMSYEYDGNVNDPHLARLTAELPERPQELAADANVTIIPQVNGVSRRDQARTVRITDIDYVHHKGSRTCSVTYRDVALGDATLRLPVDVDVRVGKDGEGERLRSARLMNFQRVNMDKAQVWEAARAFAGLSDEDQAWRRLAVKFLGRPVYDVRGVQADPNDAALMKRLLAKYPVPHPGTGTEVPRRTVLDPNDAKMIRKLVAYYRRIEREEERRAEAGAEGPEAVSPAERQLRDLGLSLEPILTWHRGEARPTLPQPDANDLRLVRQLQPHYEPLVAHSDRGLGGRLKALWALSQLNQIAENYDGYEENAKCYLRMMQEASLSGMYMDGGRTYVVTLAQSGRYDKANALLPLWADWSVANNDAADFLRFASWETRKEGNCWSTIQLLDRFLKKSGLSPLQRYEGLALRAIAYDRIDRLLATPADEIDDEARQNYAEWILSNTTRAAVVRTTDTAIRQALSAWQSLGPARDTDARPYSSANMSPGPLNFGYVEATRLQETSAQLDQIIRRRSPQPQPTQPGRSVQPPPTRRSGRSNRPALPQRPDDPRSAPVR